MSTSDVAFLAYHPLKQKREDNSFDGNGNFGAKTIADVLARAGIAVGYCSPESAHEHKVVLVSFTSTYDLIAFYKAVALRGDWKRRSFRVVGGGFGMQNPTAVRNYMDYAVFGRAEEIAPAVVESALLQRRHEHSSVMNLPELSPVKIAQAKQVYPHDVEGRREEFIGCQRKCRFCHYTWARRYVGKAEDYVQTELSASTPEITWDQLCRVAKKQGRVRSAIDGFSARLRVAYGKSISDAEIVEAIERVGSFGGTSTVLAYNISNMPTESQQDRDSLYAALRKANPRGRVIVVIQSTPFRPSLVTPMQWEPVKLLPSTNDLAGQCIVEKSNLRAVHSFSNEGAWSHFETVVVERATPASDNLFHSICFAPRLQSGPAAQRIRIAEHNFDLKPYLREYATDEKHPGWFLESYTPRDRLRRLADDMRKAVRADV